jgi:hypothetical protein
MKQIFILLMVAMYATMFTACSKDNETLNSDKEVLTIVVEDETFSFQIESPQLGIIHVNWGDGKQNEYKGEKDDDMYYIEKNILMHKRGNTLLQSRTSTI